MSWKAGSPAFTHGLPARSAKLDVSTKSGSDEMLPDWPVGLLMPVKSAGTVLV